MQIYSKVAFCCLALMLIVSCALLTGCSSTLNATEYDQAAKECNDAFLNSMPEGQHVFIDPQLANHEYAPISLHGVEQKLTQLEDKASGKIRFRVIAKQINKPDMVRNHSVTSAQLLSPLMLEKAKCNESFPNDNYVFILLTRYKDDVQSTSMETTCSPELTAAYPPLAQRLNRGITTNVQISADQLLPNPLDEAVLLVAREVTDQVAQAEKAKSEQEETLRKAQEAQQRIMEASKRAAEERQQKVSNGKAPLWLFLGALLGTGLTLICVLVFKRTRANNNW